MGWSALVVTDNDPQQGQVLADELAQMMWDRRERVLFTKEKVSDAVDEVRASEPSQRPYILADGSDSTSAGSTGDSNYLLTYLLENPIDDVVYITITDADVALSVSQLKLEETYQLRLVARYRLGFLRQ